MSTHAGSSLYVANTDGIRDHDQEQTGTGAGANAFATAIAAIASRQDPQVRQLPHIGEYSDGND